jgi:glucoamylase
VVADAGFLELVRLGIKSPYDREIINSLQVVDAQIGVTTPNGMFWHRYTDDGYGEMSTGAPWAVTDPDTFTTHGRLWPIFRRRTRGVRPGGLQRVWSGDAPDRHGAYRE